MTRLDRLARSTRDLLNTLATIGDKGAGFRSVADPWADTTSPTQSRFRAAVGIVFNFPWLCSRRRGTARSDQSADMVLGDALLIREGIELVDETP